MVRKITSWSFSRWSDHSLCPLKAKFKHVDRIKEPGNAAMDRGTKIHDSAAHYIKGAIARVPTDLKLVAPTLKDLRKRYKKSPDSIVVEDTWAFTRDWEVTQWDNWNHCWVRIKLDCAYFEDATTMVVIDWKTGKFRAEQADDYIMQLELYALGAMLTFPQVEVVKPRLVYTDLGTVYPVQDGDIMHTRGDLAQLRKAWEQRTKPMLRDGTFAPRPNDKCRWCHYRNSNKAAGGGQCKF